MAEFSQSHICAMAFIKFSCQHCGCELTVPVEQRGVSGPCPQCQNVVQAPANAAPPVRPRPRVPKQRQPESPPQLVEEAQSVEAAPPVIAEERAPSAQPALDRRRKRREGNRGIAPDTSINFQHEEQRESAAVVKVFIATLAVAGLCILIVILATRSL